MIDFNALCADSVEQWPHGSLRSNEFGVLDGGTRSTFHPDPM
ncbi:hypothetical protein [Actinomyces naeslundii]|nr:hypothetical protein [Actinomyces naeslundii]